MPALLVLCWSGIQLSCGWFSSGGFPARGDGKGYNVILILIDALRADRLGCYSYHRKTSPFIDSLAERGTLFEDAIAPSTVTWESMPALFSGQLPSRVGAIENRRPAKDGTLLAEKFQAAG